MRWEQMNKKVELLMISPHLLFLTWLLWKIHLLKKHYSSSRRQRIKSLGFKMTSGFLLFKNADETRTKLLATKIDENKIIWSSVKLRQGYFKVSADLRKKLNDWILKHPYIINSPISNDTILIRNPINSNEKFILVSFHVIYQYKNYTMT